MENDEKSLALYEKSTEMHKYFLDWRYKLLAGYLLIISTLGYFTITWAQVPSNYSTLNYILIICAGLLVTILFAMINGRLTQLIWRCQNRAYLHEKELQQTGIYGDVIYGKIKNKLDEGTTRPKLNPFDLLNPFNHSGGLNWLFILVFGFYVIMLFQYSSLESKSNNWQRIHTLKNKNQTETVVKIDSVNTEKSNSTDIAREDKSNLTTFNLNSIFLSLVASALFGILIFISSLIYDCFKYVGKTGKFIRRYNEGKQELMGDILATAIVTYRWKKELRIVVTTFINAEHEDSSKHYKFEKNDIQIWQGAITMNNSESGELYWYFISAMEEQFRSGFKRILFNRRSKLLKLFGEDGHGKEIFEK